MIGGHPLDVAIHTLLGQNGQREKRGSERESRDLTNLLRLLIYRTSANGREV